MIASARIERTGAILAKRVRFARDPWSRTIGFIGRRRIDPDEGLYFEACTAIHTVGMLVPIDVLFLDADGSVVDLCSDAAPFRPLLRSGDAKHTLELRAGRIVQAQVRLGDRILFA